MATTSERLQQLLDGELDPADIADDPTLVSLVWARDDLHKLRGKL